MTELYAAWVALLPRLLRAFEPIWPDLLFSVICFLPVYLLLCWLTSGSPDDPDRL